MYFQYEIRVKQTLTLRIIKCDGSSQEIQLQTKEGSKTTYENVINLSSLDIAAVSIETDGTASPLSDRDLRMTTFSVGNVSIDPL